MANLLVVILHDSTHMAALLLAWQKIGLPGATILDSAGAYRTSTWLEQVGLGAMGDIFARGGGHGKTLLAAIDEDPQLEEAITTVEEIIGDLNSPHTALYFVIPVTRAGGISKSVPGKNAEGVPYGEPDYAIEGSAITRSTPVSTVDEILELHPTTVHPEESLIEVARAMSEHPRSNVACVVNEQQRLVGIIPVRLLADDLFVAVVPDEFLREARSVEETIHFAKMLQTHTAGEAMLPPTWVKKEDTVADAFHNMHENKISAIPIVNEQHQVTGIINLLELLALYSRRNTDS